MTGMLTMLTSTIWPQNNILIIDKNKKMGIIACRLNVYASKIQSITPWEENKTNSKNTQRNCHISNARKLKGIADCHIKFV